MLLPWRTHAPADEEGGEDAVEMLLIERSRVSQYAITGDSILLAVFYTVKACLTRDWVAFSKAVIVTSTSALNITETSENESQRKSQRRTCCCRCTCDNSNDQIISKREWTPCLQEHTL